MPGDVQKERSDITMSRAIVQLGTLAFIFALFVLTNNYHVLWLLLIFIFE